MLLPDEQDILRAENAQLRAENTDLRTLVGHLQEQVAAAQSRIAELEQQHTDPPPFVKPNRPKSAEPKPKRKKRVPHHNHGRKRMTPTRSVEHALERCPDCDYRLQGHRLDYSREVLELPEPQPIEVIEHRIIIPAPMTIRRARPTRAGAPRARPSAPRGCE